MSDNYVGFVDAGVLRALRRKHFRPRGQVIANWFRGLADAECAGEKFLRSYWYDGIRSSSDRLYPGQRRFFDAIGRVPGIQLRLGHLVEHADGNLRQKGVDTLLTLDLVRLAGRSVCSTAVLIVTDRDFVEAIRTAQDLGVRVLIATPDKYRLAGEIAQLADGVVDIPRDVLREMLPDAPAS